MSYRARAVSYCPRCPSAHPGAWHSRGFLNVGWLKDLGESGPAIHAHNFLPHSEDHGQAFVFFPSLSFLIYKIKDFNQMS